MAARVMSSLDRIIGDIGAGRIAMNGRHALADMQEVVAVVRAAADELIEMHEATGIDLYKAPRLLALVRTAYPEWGN